MRRKSPPNPMADLARQLPSDLRGEVPRYERLGDVVSIRLPPAWLPRRREVAAVYASVLGAKAVVLDRGVRGDWREPEVELLFGEDTETVHVENGVRYRLDVAKVMFSSGNMAERIRMGRVVRAGETVVDLFAGIGYLSLPMAVHGKPEQVVAIEVNPVAFRYLEDNVRLNRAWCVEPRLGDCRQVAPERIADRVVMGYLRAEGHLDVAMGAAKDACVLHYHEATPIEDVPGRPWSRIHAAAMRAGFEAELLAVHRIKSYAPQIEHVVLDVRLTR